MFRDKTPLLHLRLTSDTRKAVNPSIDKRELTNVFRNRKSNYCNILSWGHLSTISYNQEDIYTKKSVEKNRIS